LAADEVVAHAAGICDLHQVRHTHARARARTRKRRTLSMPNMARLRKVSESRRTLKAEKSACAASRATAALSTLEEAPTNTLESRNASGWRG